MWKYEINWNRKLASKGWSTAAFLQEMLRGAAVGNFGIKAPFPPSPVKVGTRGAWPSLDSLLEMPIGGNLVGFCEDETGRLSWYVIRIADNGEWKA